MPKERKAFLQWYEENRMTPFCLKDALADYCMSDVKILCHGLISMREKFRILTGAEITESITQPSALMRSNERFLVDIVFIFQISHKHLCPPRTPPRRG
jgi:hypothetical protein